MLEAASAAGVKGRFFATLANAYNGVTSAVTIDGETSESFDCSNGLRQGGILSPIIWAIFLTPLLDALREANSGVTLSLPNREVTVSALAYVDDIALVAPSKEKLQEALDVATRLAKKLHLTWNSGKCKVIVFGAEPDSQEGQWTVGSGVAEKVESCKYLGLKFHRTLGWNKNPPVNMYSPAPGPNAPVAPEHLKLVGKTFTHPDYCDKYESEFTFVEPAKCPDGEYHFIAWFSPVSELEDPLNLSPQENYMSCREAMEITHRAVNPWKENIDALAKKGRQSLGLVRRYGGISGSLSGGISMNLLTCFSLSRMTHDQIVWTTAAEHAPALEKVYTTGLKRILGVAPGTHNRASRELMGATSLEIIRHKALLMHAKHVHDMPDDRLTKKVWEIAAADTILGPGYLQSTPKFAAQLLAKWGIQEKLPLSKGIFKRATKTAAFTAETEQFSDRNTASKLCYLKGYAPLKGNMAPCVKARIPKEIFVSRKRYLRNSSRRGANVALSAVRRRCWCPTSGCTLR